MIEMILDIFILIYGFATAITLCIKINDMKSWGAKGRLIDSAIAAAVFTWFSLVFFLGSLVLDILAVAGIGIRVKQTVVISQQNENRVEPPAEPIAE